MSLGELRLHASDSYLLGYNPSLPTAAVGIV